ncbi:hypothetical protein AC579_3980 [Pseudocercospora musae]|uniref:Uncharacterized protein n=1 Tax=Pseudocercospora musae TaxID=113226 RepID=A0A139HWC3_9PEZI|nr:hypothetical protein AC579_3980 [Pseudocercospora musae]
MEKRVKLLVHAGAPSNRHDDEYRAAQAAAYLGLGSISVVKLMSCRCAPDQAHGHPTISHQPQHATAAGAVAAAATSLPKSDEYIEDTQLAYTALETQIFTSSGRVKSTPTPRKARADCQSHVSAHLQYTTANKENPSPDLDPCNKRRRVGKLKALQDDSSCDVPKTPIIRRTASDLGGTGNAVQHVFHGPESQSSYLPSPALLRRSNHVRHEGNRRPSGQTGSNIAGPSRSRAGLDLASVWTIRESGPTDQAGDLGDGTVTTSETTSDMPTSYSLSDVAEDSGKGRAQPLHCLTTNRSSTDGAGSTSLDKDSIPETTGGSGMSSKAVVIAGPSKPHIHPAADSQKANAHMNNFCAKELGNDRGASTAPTCLSALNPALPVVEPDHLQAQAQAALLRSATEIKAPPPRTTIQSYETHVTKMLLHLADATEFPALYRPASVLRPIEIHERGYWLIQWSSWPATHQLDFWRQLETFIGNGSAGWGIWCTRAQDVQYGDTGSTCRSSHCLTPKSVALWCWGEVVQHVYLLLYTVSMGRVRKLGLKWVDSTGVVVVQMQGSSDD